MTGLYLPTTHKEKLVLKHEPTGRQTVLLIPGAANMDISQLREIIQWQQEKFAEESQKLGPKPKRKYSGAEGGKALKEFRDAVLRRQRSTHNRNSF